MHFHQQGVQGARVRGVVNSRPQVPLVKLVFAPDLAHKQYYVWAELGAPTELSPGIGLPGRIKQCGLKLTQRLRPASAEFTPEFCGDLRQRRHALRGKGIERREYHK